MYTAFNKILNTIEGGDSCKWWWRNPNQEDDNELMNVENYEFDELNK